MNSALIALLAFCLCLPLMGDNQPSVAQKLDALEKQLRELGFSEEEIKETVEKARKKNEPKNKGVIKVDSKPPLDLIIHLKKLGYSSKQVRSILRDMDVDFAKFGNEEWSAIRSNFAPYAGAPPKWDLPAMEPPSLLDKGRFQQLKALAEKGDAKAQNSLGHMYEKGEEVLRDHEEAVKWFRKAAQQGEAKAQYNLGHMYEYGRGVEQDSKEAANWYRKSAERGFAPAQ